MDKKDILARVDHTLLDPTASWEDIRRVLDDALHYGTASACIPPAYVRQAAEQVEGLLPICTVIGFPNGYSTVAVKTFEAAAAVQDGADEIDMVLNIGLLKAHRDAEVQAEIMMVHDSCRGKLVKVIIETCLLTEEEKIRACHLVT